MAADTEDPEPTTGTGSPTESPAGSPTGSTTNPPKEPPVASSTSTSTAAVSVGQAVHFRFTDPIFGNQLDRSGIVIAVTDDEVSVAPVENYTVTVQADAVQPLTELVGA